MLEQAGEVANKVLWNKNIWCLALISYNAFSTFEMRAIQDNFFFFKFVKVPRCELDNENSILCGHYFIMHQS